MTKKVYPFKSDFGIIYIEAEEQDVVEEEIVDDDGVITVRKTTTKEGGKKFEESLGVLEHVSKSVLSKVSKVNAAEISLEMGLSFSGGIDVPFIARCASEANFKITVTWKGEISKEYEKKEAPNNK